METITIGTKPEGGTTESSVIDWRTPASSITSQYKIADVLTRLVRRLPPSPERDRREHLNAEHRATVVRDARDAYLRGEVDEGQYRAIVD